MNIGTYFNNKGVTSDQINKGSMAVTELEVYRVTDGEREIIPWRKAPEWKEKQEGRELVQPSSAHFIGDPWVWIPKVVLLTTIDLACRKVAASVENVFKSGSIQEVVKKVSTLVGLQFNNIHLPSKNNVSEMELDVDISILALLALRQFLYLTEDYLEGLQGKLKRFEKCGTPCIELKFD
ncbi:hypothetical protein DPMN_119007 [Dreissena polymorpha]|uniref:Uncharacterized protein n=1 Tax=Dreissena polymorpha TaxID=45954 RepID=A0A9D4GHI3_DREPO|nr:hypothetical protein DPMN_119007 [Dreissena polymorpha]